jgi:general secretion pathway protein D
MNIYPILYSFCLLLAAGAAGYSQNQPVAGEGIILNFKGASLDSVLEYLSRAAGYTIIKETKVEGTVDVFSYQPISKEEAVELLNTVLHEKGYAAIRNGRTLTIVPRDAAKTRDIPVKTGNSPESIPKNDEMVTQVIPVRYTNAIDLIENLQPLLPEYATMSANESSNAIILTDTQSNVRRMVEIVRALDTSISSISTVRVFPMNYSDATEIAEVINELFTTEESTENQRGGRGGFFPFGPGGPGGPGGRRGGGDEGSETESDALKAASKVVAVADESSNSLIISAPEEYMPMIESLIQEIDIPMEDITEVRVFKLEYADATELAEQIQELFPDESSQSQGRTFQFGRGGFPGGPPMPAQNSSSDSSQRQLQQTTVRAQADPRTNSIIVFAARDTMLQIAQMIRQLDSDPARKQQVYVYQLEYADVDNVAEILRNIFENQTYGNVRDRTTNENQSSLSNRTVNTEGVFGQQGQINQ